MASTAALTPQGVSTRQGHANTLYRRLTALLGDVSYPGLDFQAQQEDHHVQVRVTCAGGRCTQTGKAWSWSGRWWRLSPHMTDSEIISTCFKATLTALEHEARETFKFKGSPVYDAHLDVHTLARLARDAQHKDVR